MNEAIIQSTAYADLLSITLPLNKGYFDKVTVYTKTGDEETKEVCRDNGVTCIETDLFTKNGAKFNRGAVYSWAFRHLLYKDWITILDSDIVLPNSFDKQFAAINPHREYFYGARRYDIPTYADYQRVASDPTLLKEYCLFRGFGYGYLQIFNWNSFIFQSLLPDAYPEHYDGSEADWRFRNFFGDMSWNPPFDLNGHHEKDVKDTGTHYLKCLPFNVIHLGITGVNSTGRHTPKFSA